MSKKSKISIKLNEDLVEIDEELGEAIDGLDNVNARIVGMLDGIESGEFEGAPEEAESTATEDADGENESADTDQSASEVADEEEEFIDDDEDDDDGD